jgi:hypothetical protein
VSEQNDTYPIPETFIDVPRNREGLASYGEGVARRDVDNVISETLPVNANEAPTNAEIAKWALQYTEAVIRLRTNEVGANLFSDSLSRDDYTLIA